MSNITITTTQIQAIISLLEVFKNLNFTISFYLKNGEKSINEVTTTYLEDIKRVIIKKENQSFVITLNNCEISFEAIIQGLGEILQKETKSETNQIN